MQQCHPRGVRVAVLSYGPTRLRYATPLKVGTAHGVNRPLAHNVPSQYWDMAGAQGEGSIDHNSDEDTLYNC